MWSLIRTTSSNQRQMRVSRHVPLSHLYKKANTHVSPPGTEMLYQGVPLESKPAPNTDAIGNKVCFSVMRGAVIPNHAEICPGLCRRILVTCTGKGANPCAFRDCS